MIVRGATSAYLAITCDTTDNDGMRDASNDNESASQGDSVVVNEGLFSTQPVPLVMVVSAGLDKIWKSLATIFYRLVYEPPFF